MFRRYYLPIVIILVAVMIASCGGNAAAPATTTVPTATTAPAATTAPTSTTAPAATTAPVATAAPTSATGGTTQLQDSTNAIQVSVPSDWTDVDGNTFQLTSPNLNFASIKASTNLNDFGNYNAPGVWVAASSQLAQQGGYVEVLDALKGAFSDCQYDSRNDYLDSVYEGKYDLFHDCSKSGNSFLILSVRPIQNPTSYLVFVIINSPSGQSVDAANQMAQTILDSFQVVGNLP
jgi:hypothetical protein